jgi:hypothetical protein
LPKTRTDYLLWSINSLSLQFADRSGAAEPLRRDVNHRRQRVPFCRTLGCVLTSTAAAAFPPPRAASARTCSASSWPGSVRSARRYSVSDHLNFTSASGALADMPGPCLYLKRPALYKVRVSCLGNGMCRVSRSGERAAVMLSAGALSRAGFFFRSRITMIRKSQDRARFGEAV